MGEWILIPLLSPLMSWIFSWIPGDCSSCCNPLDGVLVSTLNVKHIVMVNDMFEKEKEQM